MRRRTTSAVGGALLAIALLTACVPEPAPSPTPTGFASEDEAFAAAEATYRAYIDALNGIDFTDPETFEPAFSWTTGAANAADRRDFSTYYAEGFSIEGDFSVVAFAPQSWAVSESKVFATACLDVSQTKVVDANGTTTTPTDRAPSVALNLSFTSARSATGLLLDDVTPSENSGSC
ncbi:MAG: hypothetical protein DI566_03530 [Microbacterium sp.]|nr:MAG: hypothetical protein DI566_03530 [Microbacterium sp.]